MGNNETDHPEFAETRQVSMQLSDLMTSQSPLLQFKVYIDEKSERYFPGLAELTIATARKFTDVPLANANFTNHKCFVTRLTRVALYAVLIQTHTFLSVQGGLGLCRHKQCVGFGRTDLLH